MLLGLGLAACGTATGAGSPAGEPLDPAAAQSEPSGSGYVLSSGTQVPILPVLPGDGPEDYSERWWAQPDHPQESFPGPVLPGDGWLLIAGGGTLPPSIYRRFVRLAGGANARIVVIPTASSEEGFDDDWYGLAPLKRAGARSLRILHTRSREEANSLPFVAALENATGVWISGGRQWRLMDAYLGTRTHDALARVLERGGVVGGTSAGASAMASYLVRGAPEGNHVVMALGYERGFGFLRRAAVDQHLRARDRERDLRMVVDRYPHLLGLGLDEGTALEIRGNRGRVLGRGRVYIYESSDFDGTGVPHTFLREGDEFDLLWHRFAPRR
jgi:cyanophycinase